MQITQLNIADDMIDLGVGQPDPHLLPLDIMRQATEQQFSRPSREPLQYGTEQGNGFFRAELAQFLAAGYGVGVDPDHLMITAGATHGLDLICTYFAAPGDTIFVEEPSYFLALRIFKDRHLDMVAIPTDRDGPDTAALEKQLSAHQPAFFYTIPTFHNPSGATMTLERRKHLLALSREHGFKIVADEVYQLLSYGHNPPPPLATLDNDGCVFGLGSFSKILAPGLRLGWIQSHPDLLARITGGGLLQSSGGMNPFTSALVQRVIETGLQTQYLERLKSIYQKRAADLARALRTHLPPGGHFEVPRGGFFIWLRLPASLDSRSLRGEAIRARVNFQPGANFSVNRQLGNRLRLCFVYYDSMRLEEGARRLGSVLSKYSGNHIA